MQLTISADEAMLIVGALNDVIMANSNLDGYIAKLIDMQKTCDNAETKAIQKQMAARLTALADRIWNTPEKP